MNPPSSNYANHDPSQKSKFQHFPFFDKNWRSKSLPLKNRGFRNTFECTIAVCVVY